MNPPQCSACRRERTIHDAYDYNPLQVVTGKPLGWYSGDDGELCPDCMTKTLRKPARPAPEEEPCPTESDPAERMRDFIRGVLDREYVPQSMDAEECDDMADLLGDELRAGGYDIGCYIERGLQEALEAAEAALARVRALFTDHTDRCCGDGCSDTGQPHTTPDGHVIPCPGKCSCDVGRVQAAIEGNGRG